MENEGLLHPQQEGILLESRLRFHLRIMIGPQGIQTPFCGTISLRFHTTGRVPRHPQE